MSLFYFTSFLLVFIVIFSLIQKPILAEDSTASSQPKLLTQTYPQKFQADNPLYPIKRLWEKIAQKLLFFADAKVNFEKNLLNTRFSELEFAVNNKLLHEIQKTSERFAYQAGVYTDIVKTQNDPELNKKTISEFNQYSADTTVLRDLLPEGSFRRLLQYDVDTLSILSEKLK